MNKREFVLGGAGLLATAGTAGAVPAASRADGLAATPLSRPPELARGYSLAKWQRYLAHGFDVQSGATSQRLHLSQVQADQGSGPAAEQFSLLFSGPAHQPLAGGTHVLRHGTGQQVALFMQPAGLSPQGQALYHAQFNLLA